MSLLWTDTERSGKASLWVAVVVLGLLAGLALAGWYGLLGRDVWEALTGSGTVQESVKEGRLDY